LLTSISLFARLLISTPTYGNMASWSKENDLIMAAKQHANH